MKRGSHHLSLQGPKQFLNYLCPPSSPLPLHYSWQPGGSGNWARWKGIPFLASCDFQQEQLTVGFLGSWRENSGMPCTESTPSAALTRVYLTSSTWKFHHTPENLISPCPCHPDTSKAALLQPVVLNCLNCVKGIKKPQEYWRIIQIQGITQVTSEIVP